MTTFFKYRSTNNIENLLDILLNQRLYAADFKTLNDPMEGRYIYAKKELSEDQRNAVRANKSNLRILSLSKMSNNTLMWSYYADGHAGVVIGVTLKEQPIEINYVQKLKAKPLSDFNHITKSEEKMFQFTKDILSMKLECWEHEQEFRVFSHGGEFVPVTVTELIFGTDTPIRIKKLLTKIADTFCPKITIKDMTTQMLD